MNKRSGPFWDAIELAFAATEDFTNPAGNVLGAFQAAMAFLEATLADSATATARVIALDQARSAA